MASRGLSISNILPRQYSHCMSLSSRKDCNI